MKVRRGGIDAAQISEGLVDPQCAPPPQFSGEVAPLNEV